MHNASEQIWKTMLNGNIFRQAKELIQSKSIFDMNEDELTTVKAANIPLDVLPEFGSLTTLEGLEALARMFEEAYAGIS